MFIQGQPKPSHKLLTEDRQRVLLFAEYSLQAIDCLAIQNPWSMPTLLKISYLLVEGL